MKNHLMNMWLGLAVAALWLGVACTVKQSEIPPSATPDVAPTVQSENETMAEPIPLLEANSMTFLTTEIDETTLEFALILPKSFDPERPYPVLLAMPPGPQTRQMVNAGLDGYWTAAAQERGWIVVSPIAPDGVLFFNGSEALIPELLDRVAGTYSVENGRFHIAGISNGGLSAFRIAANNPERFASLTALPGFARTADFERLDRLVEIPVAMFAGENEDEAWLDAMERTANELDALNGTVTLEIIPNEGHVVRSLSGDTLFDLMDAHR